MPRQILTLRFDTSSRLFSEKAQAAASLNKPLTFVQTFSLFKPVPSPFWKNGLVNFIVQLSKNPSQSTDY